MCLRLTISRVTGKPIKVYKILRYPELTSPVYPQKWEFDRIEMIKRYDIVISGILDYCNTGLQVKLNVGFHSCRTLKDAYKIVGKGERIFEAEIPAYASYICGDYQDILSQALSIRPYWYKPVKILGFQFFIRKKIKEDKLKE